MLGIAIGVGGGEWKDSTFYEIVRVVAAFGLVVLAAGFSLTDENERRWLQQIAGPVALVAAWIVAFKAMFDAFG